MARGPEWTPTEDAIIAAAAGAGRGPADAASKMTGRTPGSVKVRACRIGIKFGPPKPDPTAKPRAKAPTPGSSAKPLRLDDVVLLAPEDAQRHLSLLAQHEDPRIRISALQALLSWRERAPAPPPDPDAVPRELQEVWKNPAYRAFLLKLLAKVKGGREGAALDPAATP